MDRALDVFDQPAPPLKPGYAKLKGRRFGSTVRDLKATGRMRRSMKVLSAAVNKVTLGFTDAVTNMRAAINNRRVRQYGVSPTDQAVVVASIHQAENPVQAKRVA